MPPTPKHPPGAFDARERRSLAGYACAVAVLHLLGWGLCLGYLGHHPAMLGLGLSAYLIGMRHAFDADHIAAVDDTVRLLLHKGRAPLGAGFFFSLGHSTVVFVLALLSALFAAVIRPHLPALGALGGIIGGLVSGLFLCGAGLLNLLVLLDMLQLWRRRRVPHAHCHLDALLARRGLLNRLCGRRFTSRIGHAWQMYPVGVLFGLGFDTASEIALLALTGGAAASRLPAGAVLALPLLFAAGMALMDTADGVLMTRAYGWAFLDPVRRMFYNLTTTSLSVAAALLIGGIELAQVLVRALGVHAPWADALGRLSFSTMGYLLVALFLGAWTLSYAAWRLGRFGSAAATGG